MDQSEAFDQNVKSTLLAPLQVLISTPFATVKTLVQLGYEPLPEVPSHNIWGTPGFRRPGIIPYCKTLYATHGLWGLYVGWMPRLAQSVVFEQAQRYFMSKNKSDSEDDSLAITTGLEIAATCFATLFSHPFRVVANHMTAQLVEDVDTYGNMFSTFQHIIKDQGFSALYNGIIPALLTQASKALAVGMIVFAIRRSGIFDTTSSAIVLPAGMDKKQVTKIWENVIALSLSNYIFYPFDVVTTMMTIDSSTHLALASAPFRPNFQRWQDCWTFLSQEDGYGGRGLLRGSKMLTRFFKTPLPSAQLGITAAM